MRDTLEQRLFKYAKNKILKANEKEVDVDLWEDIKVKKGLTLSKVIELSIQKSVKDKDQSEKIYDRFMDFYYDKLQYQLD
jgi:hypothetical protein